MIELSPEIVTIILLSAVILGMLGGFYVAVPLGASALAMGYVLFGTPTFDILYSRFLNIATSYTLLAVPLFIFMGSILECCGIAEKMYDALYIFLGGLRGGLAIVTILLGTILAACVGIIAASISMLSLVALPAMVRRGYSKSLASGVVCASGCLGILIPPSIMLVVYGEMAMISVGKLLMGAFIPGITLSAIYCAYVFLISLLSPATAPAIPSEERRVVPFIQKTIMLLRSAAPVGLLILSVLGVIFLGIAAPTEAAAAGGAAAILIAMAYRRFTWQVLYHSLLETMRIFSMVMLIGGFAFGFIGIFLKAGCGEVVQNIVLGAPGGQWGIFAVIMLLFFLLGFIMDWIGIMFIMVPLIASVPETLGFDPVWFGIMLCINLQTSFMTPPFAGALFILRGTAPPELGISTADIIRGMFPFVVLILVGLLLCVAFPELILWLPGMMIR